MLPVGTNQHGSVADLYFTLRNPSSERKQMSSDTAYIFMIVTAKAHLLQISIETHPAMPS
jgi:hypothetical protein